MVSNRMFRGDWGIATYVVIGPLRLAKSVPTFSKSYGRFNLATESKNGGEGQFKRKCLIGK